LENRAPATGPITCTFLAKPPSLLTRGLRHAATGRVKCGADPRLLAALIAGATNVVGLGLYRVETRAYPEQVPGAERRIILTDHHPCRAPGGSL
jgi:hypothetical protein